MGQGGTESHPNIVQSNLLGAPLEIGPVVEATASGHGGFSNWTQTYPHMTMGENHNVYNTQDLSSDDDSTSHQFFDRIY